MVDYDKKIADLKKKMKENDKKIAQKIGAKILENFLKEQKKSKKSLEEIIGKKPTNSAIVSYILSRYAGKNIFENNDTSTDADEEFVEITNPEEEYEKYQKILIQELTEKYRAADVFQYADIDEIFALGIIVSRAIGRQADINIAKRYFSNSGSQKYFKSLGVRTPENTNESQGIPVTDNEI